MHFPEGKVKFPCFNDTALFVYVRQRDPRTDASRLSQIHLDCNIIQPGTNIVKVGLYEEEWRSSLFDVHVHRVGSFSEFRFFGESHAEPTIYMMTFEATSDDCVLEKLSEKDQFEVEGNLQRSDLDLQEFESHKTSALEVSPIEFGEEGP